MEYWVSTKKMTIYVRTNKENLIVECAPIIRKFKGQSFKNLLNWLHKLGEVTYKLIGEK